MSRHLGIMLPLWGWLLIAWVALTVLCFAGRHHASSMFDLDYRPLIWLIGSAILGAFLLGSLL